MKFKVLFLFLFFFCLQNVLFAANDFDDYMRSTGKIYVVVAVIAVGLLGLAGFLFYMDRKLTKLENQINNHGKS